MQCDNRVGVLPWARPPEPRKFGREVTRGVEAGAETQVWSQTKIANLLISNVEECYIRFTIDGSKVEADAIHAFNQAEKHDYLVQNGKFNKRQAVKVQNNIYDLKKSL